MASTALPHHLAPAPSARDASRPSLALRLRVLARAHDLTRALAAGADPSSSAELGLQARRLTAERPRREMIAGLERALREARTPPVGLTARAPYNRRAILDAEPFLGNLVARLREADEPRAAGAAQVELLLIDGCGPLYAASAPGALASAAFRAAQSL
jgi:hypothetical protein